MGTEARQGNLSVLGEPASLGCIRGFVREICSRSAFTADQVEEVVVAICEASSNSIVHGRKGDENPIIHISYRLTPEKIEFSVSDNGPGFNLTAVRPGDPSRLEVGKLGIRLIRELMDRVAFDSGPDGTTVHLTKLVKSG